MTERASAHDRAAGLGHEVKLLVDMVVEHSAPWLESVLAAGHGAAGAANGNGKGEHHDSGEAEGSQAGRCGWCPLCAVADIARGERPELSQRALEQTTQLVALLRAVLADRWHPSEGVHMPGFVPQTPPASAAAEPLRATEPLRADAERVRPERNGSARVQHVSVRKAVPTQAGEKS